MARGPTPRHARTPADAAENGFVVLDRAWAERLGVQRVGGVYRIRRRALVERLAALNREQTNGSVSPNWLAQERPAVRVAG